MMVKPPEYQFLREFIDTLFGILVVLTILKGTVYCLKYIFLPVQLFFEGIMLVINSIGERCSDFVKEHEQQMKNEAKTINIEDIYIENSKEIEPNKNVKVSNSNSNPNSNDNKNINKNTDNKYNNVIDFAKIKRK